ncbi:unnamed protein product [Didymodactylos carnosus]|uniref:Uncharacterized protein n=1 Tax=Didymodactylos carnosus TaxID=1234261 RepID=A0A814YSN3_9BILA|nr:unnamed protein product [Didymodactylos carnosus]CAF1573899.1 unnamed protein product [Didymodactylos carnosus]CAF3996742.1 unnamed protein product [Didymodactylos carnosus]CAF4369500.1 unnamed protein product [Didymodactylos carnosus]
MFSTKEPNEDVQTAKLKADNEHLMNVIRQLEDDNKKLKTKISSSLPSSEIKKCGTSNSPAPLPPSRILFNNLSPLAKQRATTRMMTQKEDLPRGSITSIRDRFGINLSNQNRSSQTKIKPLDQTIEEFYIMMILVA